MSEAWLGSLESRDGKGAPPSCESDLVGSLESRGGKGAPGSCESDLQSSGELRLLLESQEEKGMKMSLPENGSWILKAIAAGGVRLEGAGCGQLDFGICSPEELSYLGAVLHTDTANVLIEHSVNHPGNLYCY